MFHRLNASNTVSRFILNVGTLKIFRAPFRKGSTLAASERREIAKACNVIHSYNCVFAAARNKTRNFAGSVTRVCLSFYVIRSNRIYYNMIYNALCNVTRKSGSNVDERIRDNDREGLREVLLPLGSLPLHHLSGHFSNFLRVDTGITICKGREYAGCPRGLRGNVRGIRNRSSLSPRNPSRGSALAESGILHSATVMVAWLIDRTEIRLIDRLFDSFNSVFKGELHCWYLQSNRTFDWLSNLFIVRNIILI